MAYWRRKQLQPTPPPHPAYLMRVHRVSQRHTADSCTGFLYGTLVMKLTPPAAHSGTAAPLPVDSCCLCSQLNLSQTDRSSDCECGRVHEYVLLPEPITSKLVRRSVCLPACLMFACLSLRTSRGE